MAVEFCDDSYEVFRFGGLTQLNSETELKALRANYYYHVISREKV